MFNYAFGIEILQAAHTISTCQIFCKTSENLIPRLTNQEGNITIFARTLSEMYDRHFQTFKKFYNTSRVCWVYDRITDSFLEWTGWVNLS